VALPATSARALAHLADTRGKRTGTVAIASARELAAFCWETAILD
jgi:hypothetical protein